MSAWRNFRALYNAFHKVQHKLLPPVVVIVIVLLIVRWANKPPRGHVWHYEGEEDFQQLDDADIQKYISAMDDGRSEECKEARNTQLGKKSASIILDFADHEFYDLKMTLESIIKHSPQTLYREIIILDDGTGHQHVSRDAMKYLTQPKFSKVKAFRSEQSQGQALSRFKASKMASGDILVFLSSRTAVNQGWLEPLLEQVTLNNKLIAVPAMDSLLSNYRYFKTPDNLINVFNWKMTTLFKETDQEGPLLDTPVMTGDAFAVDRKFFDVLGNYDEGFARGGGENLEMSMRTWMCGGSIVVVPCSRVAVVDALRPRKITTDANFRRVVELWVGSKYQSSSYNVAKISMEKTESEAQSLHSRQRYLEKHISCQSFYSYLRGVAKDILLPPDAARGFGKVRANTGYCLNSHVYPDGRIRMQHCKPHMYEPDMVFTLDMYGRLRHDEFCVDTTSSLLTLQACKANVSPEQQWQITPKMMIQSADDNKHCMAHDTDAQGTHFLTLKECSEERAFTWSFIPY